jgi:biopolymer transport protein ExbD
MARTFRRKNPTHPISELNVTNLIDVAFTLLIIFMIATPLIQEEQTIQVNLPTETKRPQDTPDKDLTFQSIAIDKSGVYHFGNTPIEFEELRPRLEELAARPKPPVIRIRADYALQWQQVVRLMDEIKRQNLTKITFDTQSVE